ncbi:MAG: hypothetical protein H7Z75_22495 [Ferruginibacter sp.]|nr:hypothetical protein [Cytophagales bacterium]
MELIKGLVPVPQPDRALLESLFKPLLVPRPPVVPGPIARQRHFIHSLFYYFEAG